ncbi:MAG: hypothetical protein ACSLFK_00230 [Gemmatimonadaceae bacterium]
MRTILKSSLLVLAVSACASARSGEGAAPGAKVFFAGDKPPVCAIEKIGTLNVRLSTTAMGEARKHELSSQLGKRARALGADAVIGVTSSPLLTVVVARSAAEARAKVTPPSTQDFTGTLVKFSDPGCTG